MKTFILTLSLLSGALMASAQQTVKPATSAVTMADGKFANKVYDKSKSDTTYTGEYYIFRGDIPALLREISGNNMPTVKLPNNDANMPVVKTDRTKYNMPVVGRTDSTAIKEKYKEMLLGPKKP